MKFEKANENDYASVKAFYWKLIDEMQSENDKIGWKKGIYPSDDYLVRSLAAGELYKLTEDDKMYACVILNSAGNEGYQGVQWSIDCEENEVLIPHALAVAPSEQGQGIGTRLVNEIIRFARSEAKKAIRLDILGTNISAEKLYTKCGFRFVEAKQLFYEDTGLTEYKMYELKL